MKEQNIVTLIQSLSPTEKQQFKKSNPPGSDFVLLFDYLNKYKKYDYQKIKTFFNKKNNKKGAPKKGYTSGYLSVIKNYLYDKIMETLRTIYTPRRISYEMAMKSMNADILLEKGLYSLAKNEIQAAKSKSLQSSFPIEKLMLFRKESIIQFFEDYAQSSYEEIDLLYEQRIETAEQLLLEIKYARILTVLSYQYFKGEKSKEILQSFMKEDYMQDPNLAKEFGTKYLFNWVHAQFAEFQNKPEEAIQFFEKTIQTWLDYPEYIEGHPRMYLGACFTYLKYSLQQKRTRQSVLSVVDLELLLSKISKIEISEDVAVKFKQLFHLAQLLNFRKSKEYEKVIEISPLVLDSMESFEITTDFVKILIRYFIAVSHFYNNNYKATNELLHDVIYDDKIKLNANPEYYNHVLMLYVLTLYELENFRFLKSELKKIKKKILDFSTFDSIEDHFFKMVGQLISPRYENQKELVFERFYDRFAKTLVENISEDKVEFQVILDWLALKME